MPTPVWQQGLCTPTLLDLLMELEEQFVGHQ